MRRLQNSQSFGGGGTHSLTPQSSCLTCHKRSCRKFSGAFTLAEVFHPAEQSKRIAFTLAEVLITLGIIGVVAALTMPVLTANYRKQVVITRMQKFYSSINQALKLSEVENGEATTWTYTGSNLDSEATLNWWNIYMAKYFSAASVEKVADGILVKNSDGSSFGIYIMGTSIIGINPVHIIFCVNADACQKHLDANSNKLYNFPLDGKNTFLFSGRYNKIQPYFNISDNPYKTRDVLLNSSTNHSTYGCANSYKAYCAALIEYDGWKIAKDYPIKF